MATALDVISLQEAKDYLVVDFADHDALIQRAIGTAVALVEQHTQHRLYNRDITKVMQYEADVYDYPYTIVSLKEGTDDVAYTVCPYTLFDRITTDYLTNTKKSLALNVGYATKEEIPAPLTEACFRLIAYYYENREAHQAIIPSDVYQQLQPYRRDASI